jgi:hypothetical protein
MADGARLLRAETRGAQVRELCSHKGTLMDLAFYLGRAWDFIIWFATMVIGTVANSIFGGWSAVLALAGIALVLFLLTRVFVRKGSDD